MIQVRRCVRIFVTQHQLGMEKLSVVARHLTTDDEVDHFADLRRIRRRGHRVPIVPVGAQDIESLFPDESLIVFADIALGITEK